MKLKLDAKDIERLENTSLAAVMGAGVHAPNSEDTMSPVTPFIGDNTQAGLCTNMGLCSPVDCIQISATECTNTCGCTATVTDPTCQIMEAIPTAAVAALPDGPALLLGVIRRS